MAAERSTQVVSCQECHKERAKYSCPACSQKTCSLECCKAHKIARNCSGKRNRTNYLPLAHMNDATLASDYHFLEDVLTQVDGGKRLLQQVGATKSNAANHKKLNHRNENDNDKQEGESVHVMLKILENKNDEEPTQKKQRTSSNNNNKWLRLVQQAQERETTLMLMPPGMQRHETNTSWYQFKTDTIHWKVDLQIHSSDDNERAQVVSIQKVDENTSLVQVLSKSIPENDVNEYHLLLKKLPCPSNKPLYVELDREVTLKAALRDKTIIEYPTIEVVPKAALQRFTRSIQEV